MVGVHKWMGRGGRGSGVKGSRDGKESRGEGV